MEEAQIKGVSASHAATRSFPLRYVLKWMYGNSLGWHALLNSQSYIGRV
jgi:hypothetical protein